MDLHGAPELAATFPGLGRSLSPKARLIAILKNFAAIRSWEGGPWARAVGPPFPGGTGGPIWPGLGSPGPPPRPGFYKLFAKLLRNILQ